ncbi:hypothetical protein CsSME_00001144 [Camellia sinensis var. sinensis]
MLDVDFFTSFKVEFALRYDIALVLYSLFSARIKIHVVFVSTASGEVLTKYVSVSNMELWITPSSLYSGWSIMAVFFISFLGIVRQEAPRASHVRGFYGMIKCRVKAIPSLIFTANVEDNYTSTTCAICLEDCSVGEKLRILPYHHKFLGSHVECLTWN